MTTKDTKDTERDEDGTVKDDASAKPKGKDAETQAVGDPEAEGRLATGVAPAWATDPTTNKNAAQKFV